MTTITALWWGEYHALQQRPHRFGGWGGWRAVVVAMLESECQRSQSGMITVGGGGGGGD